MNTNTMIYLDSNATTSLAPEVRDAMRPFLHEAYGNPSSLHRPGQDARTAVDTARRQVAGMLGTTPGQITFTGSGSEANNMAIKGVLAAQGDITQVITSTVEHSSVKATCKHMQSIGAACVTLRVQRNGQIDLAALKDAITSHDGRSLVTLMWANNETGTVFPIPEIAEIVSAEGALLHVDAIQAVGKIPIDVTRSPVDLLSLSGHKFHAPKGVGALYMRRGLRCAPLIHGGGQENGLRSGTHNVAGIVGLGMAATLTESSTNHMSSVTRPLRDRLEQHLLDTVPGLRINGDTEHRLPNTTHFCLDRIEADALILRLDDAGICASAGSACSAGVMAPSHVLMAMGRNATEAQSAVRLSLSRYTREEDIDLASERIIKTIASARR